MRSSSSSCYVKYRRLRMPIVTQSEALISTLKAIEVVKQRYSMLTSSRDSSIIQDQITLSNLLITKSAYSSHTRLPPPEVDHLNACSPNTQVICACRTFTQTRTTFRPVPCLFSDMICRLIDFIQSRTMENVCALFVVGGCQYRPWSV